VKSWCCRRLAAAMINRRSLLSGAARRHEPHRLVRARAWAAVCPKRSPSPLLISSPLLPPNGHHDVVNAFGRSLSTGTTLIRLLIRPTGGPGRCRRPRRTGLPQGTPKRPDQVRVTSGHRHRAWRSSSQEHRNDTHRSGRAAAATRPRSCRAQAAINRRWSAAERSIVKPRRHRWGCGSNGVFGPTRRAEIRRDGHCE